jgi:signal transduction histidine kinase
MAGQTGAAAAVAYAGGRHGLEVALLVIIVVQLAEWMPLRWAVGWMIGQTAALYAFSLTEDPVGIAMQICAALGFQVFGLATMTFALREQRAREALARANGDLRAAQALLADRSRLQERVRISRELHDVLGHHLTALTLNLEVARHLLLPEPPRAEAPAPPPSVQAAAQVATAHGVARLLLSEVRQVVGALRDEEPVGLARALRDLAAGVPRPRCHLALPADVDGLVPDPVRAQVVLRCVQEIVTNAVRHAGARNLWIALEPAPEGLHIHARDDGRGTPEIRPGLGLRGMRERLEEAGGGLRLASPPGGGFEVTALLGPAVSA